MKPSSSLTRRDFLRSAGGITFLALTPIGRGLFAAVAPLKPLTLPIFTALPYVQPGPETRLVEGAETTRIAWQTLHRPADFVAEFGRDENYGQTAPVTRTERIYGNEGAEDGRYNYVCSFTGLQLGTEYRYRVRCNGEVIAEGYFTTRQPRGRRVRFVAFGDNSHGDISDRAIAYQAYRVHPDFIMNAGDNVYVNGLDNEYSRYFFPVYNADVPGPRLGAPLLRSVPFYTVMANHDVHAKDPETQRPCADFDADPDSLAYYTNFYFPLNGPPAPSQPTVTRGAAGRIEDFKRCAGPRFPGMANYSYDYGDAHFLCLDSNVYVDPTDAALQHWIDADLAATDARWRFVVYHHPAFNVGAAHYREQHMRALCPLFEKYGVDFVLSGHEHNYQRTVPLSFTPGDLTRARTLHTEDRLVSGGFTCDTKFDGEQNTHPRGISHVTTGAGGMHLYDAEYNNNPAKWTLAEDAHTAYVALMVTDRHSITVFDLDGNELLMRQIDERGDEIDRIGVTKG
jgi:hypothetical protein